MIDTLKLSRGLQRAGMSADQADGVTEAIRDAQADYLTKQDLEIALNRLELRLTKIICSQTLLVIALLGLAQIGLRFWPR